jgi:hypothetical protein
MSTCESLRCADGKLKSYVRTWPDAPEVYLIEFSVDSAAPFLPFHDTRASMTFIHQEDAFEMLEQLNSELTVEDTESYRVVRYRRDTIYQRG